MRTIFIGDVHGCLDELLEIEKKLSPTPEDRVVFLGDLINKWPDSIGVVKFVFARNYECVSWNHERAYAAKYETSARFRSIRQGLTQEEHDWLISLPAFIETDRFIAVHAGLVPWKAPSEEDAELLCEIRTWNAGSSCAGTDADLPWYAFYQGEKPVFYGHWAAQRRHYGGATFGLDDGCVYGGNLCAYVLETGETVSVPARRAYETVPLREEREILVIAHDEESKIGECLGSLALQTVKPRRIVVVAHNCSDETANVARETVARLRMDNVLIDEFRTEGTWPAFARIRAFELAEREYLACIDGDSVASRDWLEKITTPLSDPGIAAVGGNVRFRGDFFGNLASFWFFDMDALFPWRRFYFWGANFACRKSDYARVGGLVPIVGLKDSLRLNYWAEDCYLSLALAKLGKVRYARDAKVRTYPGSLPNSIERWKNQESDRKKLFRFFEK